MNNDEQTISVESEDLESGEQYIRLDVFLHKKLGMSRSWYNKAVKKSLISSSLSGLIKKPGYKVSVGECLYILQEQLDVDAVSIYRKHKHCAVDIVYSINGILLVNKPANILVHVVSTDLWQDNIVGGVLAANRQLFDYGDPRKLGVVHRLDKLVSGALILTETEQAYYHMIKIIENRMIKKFYVAICIGKIPEEGLVHNVCSNINRDKKTNKINSEYSDTQNNAETHFVVLKKHGLFGIVLLRLITGRVHQARIHMQECGMYIFGDAMYNDELGEVYSVPRIMLHAIALDFVDHVSTRHQPFIPIPEDMTCAIQKLLPIQGVLHLLYRQIQSLIDANGL